MCISVSAFGVAALRQAHSRGQSAALRVPSRVTRRRRRAASLWAAGALALLAADGARAVESRFDAGDEGWTLVDAKTGVGGAAVVWQAAGQISTNDVYDWNAFAAPAAFLGDLRGTIGGTLSFELQAARQDAGAASYFTAALRSGPDLLVWFGGAPSLTEMTRFSVAFDASGGWELNPTALGAPGSGTAVDAAAFRAFVAQVDGLYIDADWRFGSDNTTLDNVVLAAVPEPQTWALMLAGLAACVRRARQARRP